MDKEEKKVAVETDAVIIIGIMVLLILLPAIWAFFNVYLGPVVGPIHFETYWKEAVLIARQILNIIITVSFPVSLFLLIAIVYCVEQLKHIRKKEQQLFDLKVEAIEAPASAGNPALAQRWDNVKKLVSSENENDWRQSIMEADIILEDILTVLGYQGSGIGEKLKRVELGDMKTRQDAWDAHLVRNAIAHEGSAYKLTQHDAQQTIQQYKKVFEEFYYI